MGGATSVGLAVDRVIGPPGWPSRPPLSVVVAWPRASACRIAARVLAVVPRRSQTPAPQQRCLRTPSPHPTRRAGDKEETMEFCIGTTAKIDAVDLVKQAEDVGASHFGVGEGPLLFSDPYQYLALAARDTSTIKLGTWVTNPLTRIAAGHRQLDRHPERARPRPHVPGHRHREQRAALDGQPPRHPEGARLLADRHPRPARGRARRTPLAQAGPRDRVPRLRTGFGTTSPTRSRCGCPRAARRASRSRPSTPTT